MYLKPLDQFRSFQETPANVGAVFIFSGNVFSHIAAVLPAGAETRSVTEMKKDRLRVCSFLPVLYFCSSVFFTFFWQFKVDGS